MKKLLLTFILAPSLAFGLTGFGFANEEPTWGELTKFAIHEIEGWNQGEHSADPSGDGLGKEDRVGLANVVERGNMAATTALLALAVGYCQGA